MPLFGTGFHGDSFVGADNTEILKDDFRHGPYDNLPGAVPRLPEKKGHILIPYLQVVQSRFAELIAAFDDLGVSRESWSLCGVTDICWR